MLAAVLIPEFAAVSESVADLVYGDPLVEEIQDSLRPALDAEIERSRSGTMHQFHNLPIEAVYPRFTGPGNVDAPLQQKVAESQQPFSVGCKIVLSEIEPLASYFLIRNSISVTTLSALKKLYFLPQTELTEQKRAAKGASPACVHGEHRLLREPLNTPVVRGVLQK